MPTKIPADYYNTKVDGEDALQLTTPPTPGAPTNHPNLMQLYVPSENTELDLGAGKTPGIRMATDNHVHLTARNPPTTISLGAPGGAGVTDKAAGLQIVTKGEKREEVLGAVREVYGNQKIETVEGAVWETYKSTKKEIVEKDVEQEYHANRKETVKELSVSSTTRTDRIDGDWHVRVTGDRHEQIDGNLKHYKRGMFWTMTEGTTNDICVGEKATFVQGANVGVYADANLATTIGAKVERVSGGSVTLTSPIKITRDNITMAKVAFKIENVTATKKSEYGGPYVEKGSVKLTTMEARVQSASMFIIK